MEQYPKIYLYRRIVQAKLYIDTHYAEKVDLKNIADEAHFSKFHFIRLFKSIYGKTPRHYMTEVRIDKAKSLLAANHSVTEVCFAVGFDSVTSFTALFKKPGWFHSFSISAATKTAQGRNYATSTVFYSELLRRITWLVRKIAIFKRHLSAHCSNFESYKKKYDHETDTHVHLRPQPGQCPRLLCKQTWV